MSERALCIGFWCCLWTAVLVAAAAPDVLAKGRGRGGGIAPLTEDGLPNVQATHAVIMDVATGAEILGKSSGEVAGIASTTKIFVAMAVRKRGIDLAAITEIVREDCDYARGGARTRLEIRHSFNNLDLLRAMLIASDNRAPTALARAAGLTSEGLVAAMNEIAAGLGLVNTHFTDPTGLRGNVSTAREMAIAFKASLADPLLAEIMGTREVSVRSVHAKPLTILYRNSNKALLDGRFQVSGGKTGYTRAAGYCLLISARVAGREVIMVFLGEDGKLTRYGDFQRVSEWLESGGVTSLDTLPRVTGGGAVIGAAARGSGVL